jgi:two-component system response regulator NreC
VKEIEIYVVDDHTIVRDGIKMMLMQTSVKVIGEFSHSDELFQALKKKEPDLILLDISLPGISGIEITKIISELHPHVDVLILSALEDEETIAQAIKAGAKGFLTKSTTQQELTHALSEIKKGNRYFGTDIAKTVFNLTLKNISSNLEAEQANELTPREFEIVKLFADGLMYKEIAHQLSISIKTVEAHKANIMRKLELKSTAGLVKYAIKNKIITL